MSWSYDPSLVATSPVAWVRLAIGDTDTTDQQLQDEEINALLAAQGAPYAAATAAEVLAARYSRRVDKVMGRARLTSSQRMKAYSTLAAILRTRAVVTGGASPFAGGMTYSDKQATASDPDLIEPSFRIDMHEVVNTDPRVSSPTMHGSGTS